MEYLKDFDCTILFNPGKANAVTDVLSKKSSEVLASMMIKEWELIESFSHLIVDAKPKSTKGYLENLIIQLDIIAQIRTALQADSEEISGLIRMVMQRHLILNTMMAYSDFKEGCTC